MLHAERLADIYGYIEANFGTFRPPIASGSEKRGNGIDSLMCRENNYERKVLM